MFIVKEWMMNIGGKKKLIEMIRFFIPFFIWGGRSIQYIYADICMHVVTCGNMRLLISIRHYHVIWSQIFSFFFVFI